MRSNNIAEIRKSLRIDSKEFANRLGISIPYLSTLENKAEISDHTLYRVVKELNTTKHRIFDFSDRKRTKPDFNPHLEAFWTQGCEARNHLNVENQIKYTDRILCGLSEDFSSNGFVPISEIYFLNLFNLYCLNDLADDIKTTESLMDMQVLFAAGLAGADFCFCAAVLDKRSDIIQSFYDGLCKTVVPFSKSNAYNNIRTIREQMGLTRKDLAKKINTSENVLCFLESKIQCSNVHIDVAKKIAHVFRCDLSDLYSNAQKDLQNIMAKRIGKTYGSKYGKGNLKAALERDMGNVTLCVRDIVAFFNFTEARKIGLDRSVQFPCFESKNR